MIIQSTLNSEVTNQQKGQLLQDIARKGSNCGVCVRTPDKVCEKLSDMKKDFFGEKTKNKNKTKNEKQQQRKTITKQQQQQQETNKQKIGNWSRPGQTVWRAIDVHCWQGFSVVLRPVKTGGSAPFRFKCSSSSFSSFVIWRISARRNLNCQNSSKWLNLSKGFVLSRKIRFLRSSRLWR